MASNIWWITVPYAAPLPAADRPSSEYVMSARSSVTCVTPNDSFFKLARIDLFALVPIPQTAFWVMAFLRWDAMNGRRAPVRAHFLGGDRAFLYTTVMIDQVIC